MANVLNKFLPEDRQIRLVYIKGDIKQGVADIKVCPIDEEPSYAAIKKMPVFFRIIAISNPMNRIKSMSLPNIKYFFFDEFIANLRGGEKYLPGDEYFLIQEVYTTYNREAKTPIRIIGAGNPYSVYTPLFIGLGVDTSKLKPGAFIVGPNYTIDCFQSPPELKAQILKNNPQYQFDNAYKRYAFGGAAINDQNIRIQKTEPRGFKLKYVFKLGKDFISLHKGNGSDYKWWCCKHDETWLERIGKRKVVVFNFKDMINGSYIMNSQDRMGLYPVKEAMNRREITYNCIDAQYMLEDVYSVI